MNGDSIGYANPNIQQYVESFTSPTVTKKNGKVKKNGNYNAGFAALVSQLEGAEEMFTFTDDASKLGSEAGLLGIFSVEEDGSGFNIVAPSFSSGENSKLTDQMGGRAAVLAEETKHATQYLAGDVTSSKRNGKFGLSIGSNTTKILAEANAKLWVANSGMGNLTSKNMVPGYTFPTMLGLYKKAGNAPAVGRILLSGTTVTRSQDLGGASGATTTVNYPKSYSPF